MATSPSYGEVLALKLSIDEDDVNARIMLPSLANGMNRVQVDRGRLKLGIEEAFENFPIIRKFAFAFEDAIGLTHNHGSCCTNTNYGNQMVMIATRPPNTGSQLKGGGSWYYINKHENVVEDSQMMIANFHDLQH